MRSATCIIVTSLACSYFTVGAAAREMGVLYVKADLGLQLETKYHNNAEAKAAELRIARDTVRAIDKKHAGEVCWRLQAVDEAEPGRFPELLIQVQSTVDYWRMRVELNKGPGDIGREFGPVVVVNKGEIEVDTVPSAVEIPEKVVDWFMELFLKPSGMGSLRGTMQSILPLAEGRVSPATMPPLPAECGLILLPYDRYRLLSNSKFRLECQQQPLGIYVTLHTKGTVGKATLIVGGQPITGILVKHQPPLPDLTGLDRGIVYLEEYVFAPDDLGGLVLDSGP